MKTIQTELPRQPDGPSRRHCTRPRTGCS